MVVFIVDRVEYTANNKIGPHIEIKGKVTINNIDNLNEIKEFFIKLLSDEPFLEHVFVVFTYDEEELGQDLIFKVPIHNRENPNEDYAKFMDQLKQICDVE